MKTVVVLILSLFIVCGICWAGDEECCDSNNSNCFTSPGNDYTCYCVNNLCGNCVWWARYKRPDLENLNGTSDAVDWYQNSANMGFAVGNIPVQGSIVVFNYWMTINGEYRNVGHVAYIEYVIPDGDSNPRNNFFHVSEMGYDTWNGKHEYDYSSSSFNNGLIGFIYPVGVYADGRTDYTVGSQNKKVLDAFLLTYNRHKSIIGYPKDNGGGVFVHEYKGAADQNFSVWIQDFYNPDTNEWYALVLNDLESVPEVRLLKGAIRSLYMSDDGPYKYGVNFTEEISRVYANSPYDLSGESIQPGDYVTAQKFKRRLATGINYNNERRTLVWKPGLSAAEHIPIGEYEIYAESCAGVCPEEGDQIYVIDSWHTGLLEHSYDKPWPLANHPIANGSTGIYFTKAGTYNFVLHNSNGTRKSGWGLTVQITEGNHQFSGGGLFEPSNLRFNNLTSSSVTLLWDKGINTDDTGFTWGVYQGSAKIQTVSQRTYTVTGLSPNTAYTFKATAIDGAEESGFSNVLSLTTPAEVITYPVDFNFVEMYASEYVEPFSGAASLNSNPIHQNIYCRGGSHPTVFVRLNQVSIPGALPSVWRWYKPNGDLYLEENSEIWLDYGSQWWFYQDLDLSNSADYGSWSVQVILNGNNFGRVYFEFAPCLSPPANAVSSNVTTSSLQVNWNAAPYATGYNIAKKSGDDWLQGGNIATLYFNESGLEPSTTYTYRIFSTAGSYVSENYTEITITTTAQSIGPAAPQGVRIIMQ